MANQKIYNIKINGIRESIDGASTLHDKLNGATQGVTNYGNAMREATKQVKAIQGQMVGLDKSSQQWKQLAKLAGDYQDKINDIREATRRYASDTKDLDDVINLAKSTTSAFGILQGVMNEFGMESEEAAEAIKKLQSTMTILTSLQQLQNSLKGSSATATLLTKAMNLLSLGMKGASTASKALRLALASIGIGLVITAVTLLVEHWEDLCNWFNKSFPIFNKCGGFMNTLESAAIALGKAVLNWIVNPFKTVAEVFKNLFAGDFVAAMEAAQKGIKQQFQGSVDIFNKAFKEQVNKGQEEITLKQIEEENKRTKHNLEMLKAQKGNQAKYSKEGIALQKKDFEERKRLAKGNQDELNKIAVDEANFYRECQESKSAAAQKAARTSVKAHKDAADEQKKIEEQAKKDRDKAVKAEVDTQKSIINYKIENAKYDIEAAKKNVERYSAGPVEDYREAVEELNESERELISLQKQLKQYELFTEYRDNIDASITSFTEFNGAVNEAANNIAKLFEKGVKTDDVTKITSDAIAKVKLFSNLTEDELKTLYGFILNNNKELINSNKVTQENITDVQKKALAKEMEGIEKSTLQYELEQDKKSDAAKAIAEKIKAQWDNYLEHVKKVYGEDSKEYLEAQKKKQQATAQLTDSKSSWGYGGKLDKLGINNGKFGNSLAEFGEKAEAANELLHDTLIDPLEDTFSMLAEMAVEEAQEALDEVNELLDAAHEKTEASRERMTELENAMSNASGSRLEELKQQQAEEVQMMLERDAEEKRLEKEKEKREKELEKKQKQQRKTELQFQLINAITSNALAVVKALTAGPIIGPILAGIIGAMGAVQIAVITKQLTKLADGGLLEGASHSNGGIKVGNTGIEVEGGEYVVNKRSTAKYLPLLQALNEEGAKHKTRANQIGKFADGGQLNYQRIDDDFQQMSQTATLQRAIQSIDMHPVVEVVEVAKGLNNLSAVRESAGGSSLLK